MALHSAFLFVGIFLTSRMRVMLGGQLCGGADGCGTFFFTADAVSHTIEVLVRFQGPPHAVGNPADLCRV